MSLVRRERMSGIDTAWLRMDMPTNPMVITGVLVFRGKVRLRDVKRAIRTRFLAFDRFGQRAVQDATGAWWEDDGTFDIDSHVHVVALPGKADKKALQDFVSDLASTPLDRSKPLWQFHLVDNYAGGSALVMRIHHCYADGIALVQVMLSLTSESAPASLAAGLPETGERSRGETDLWSLVLGPVGHALEGASRLGRSLFDQGRELAENPAAAQAWLEEVARRGVDFASEVAALALMQSDSPTRLKGPLGVRKRVAWAEPLPLDEVKAMGKALGCSINDVLVAMASGALRDYLRRKGDAVDAIEMRAVVPVNLRPDGHARELGNCFGLVFLNLPVGIDDPLERLAKVRRRMKALKTSWQPLIVLGLLHALGTGPRVLQEQVAALLARNASAVMTNVPGPRSPVYFAGRAIEELDFWVPQSGGIGLGLSILSYNGRIQFGVMTDAGRVPDPEKIVRRFRDEFDRLMWLTLMSPWAGEGEAPGSAGARTRPSRHRPRRKATGRR